MEKEKSFRQGKEIQRKRKWGGGGPAWVPEAPVPSPLLASTRWRNGSTFLERHYSSVSEEAESRSPRLPLGRQSPSSKRWLPLCRWGGVACGQRGPLREPSPSPPPPPLNPGILRSEEGLCSLWVAGMQTASCGSLHSRGRRESEEKGRGGEECVCLGRTRD